MDTRFELIGQQNAEVAGRIRKSNERFDQLQVQARELMRLDERFADAPFFNCWFLSLSQLQLLLEKTTSNQSLYAQLEKTKFLVFGSSNFYYEFVSRIRLKG